MRKLFALLFIFSVVSLGAQEATQTKAPTLSEVQKLRLQLSIKETENAFLRLQAAQETFSSSRAALEAMLKSLEQPGWVLNPDKLEYVAKPQETK